MKILSFSSHNKRQKSEESISMAKKIIKSISFFLLAFIIFTVILSGAYRLIIPERIDLAAREELPSYPLLRACGSDLPNSDGYGVISSSIDYKLYGLIKAKSVTVNKQSELKLYPGGMPFGVKFITDGVLIVGFCDVDSSGGKANPAVKAGLKMNDVIVKINGSEVLGACELTSIVEGCGGASLSVTYRRDGKEATTTLTPAYSKSEKKYKTGIYVRDSGAGIGTVTFINPENYSFAGLGHGICDANTGELLPIQRGSVVNVTISGVIKGLAGSPGEVKGYFSSGKVGTLLGNTECGVYGVFAGKPAGIHAEPIPVGYKDELQVGKAYIYCTLDTGSAKKYEIEISNINKDATGNKCFNIKITDPALIEKSGGIIQGMSGSPIIQNGKLVGAVTHVMVNDPTFGYGIFIENMIKQMSDLAG